MTTPPTSTHFSGAGRSDIIPAKSWLPGARELQSWTVENVKGRLSSAAPFLLRGLALAAVLGFLGLRVARPARAETLLVVPPIAQTFWPPDRSGRTFDVGRFDCVPAAVAMDLQALSHEGVLAPDVPTDYPTVRRVFRTYFPRASQGIVPLAVPGVVAALTHQTLQARLVRLAPDSWRAFLGAELAAGRPVVVIVGDWSLLAGGWSPRGVTHAVIVTGLRDGDVFYNDPWDGKSYFMTEAAFAAAWGTTPNAWLALPIRPMAPH